MSCVHQCTRMADSCTSVNFKKQPTNGLHSCQLMTSDMYGQPDALQHDQEFDHTTLQLPTFPSCHEIRQNRGTVNGVYSITPSPSHPIQVYCDMVTSGGGWTVIQKRIDGSVDFYRNWADYKRGFGNKLGEYWLGLDNIHRMTSQRSYRLRVDMEDFEGNTRYAEYGLFKVADESVNYRLTVGQYTGTAGDSLSLHSNMQFSTKDRDNDASSSRDCANEYPSGWWHTSCHFCNLNGLYLNGAGSAFGKGITWFLWKRLHTYSMKRMELKIRPKE
ncbi:microfibril-associated glycoprotein 4-like [Actinia tenebrosa]|uniref:Microfibril-associated glycoprotein 4-like n=1 Tax=Actinia tenebrosa TaxID=6105 RepID=A0A6P8ILL3_ACTTE|nr:microfibril-associated glycoprotein 4-like [Actinia tenebrosa]